MNCALLALALAATAASPGEVRLEAEDAEPTGTTVSTEHAGFSGKGYVTGFDAEGDRIVFRFRAQKGLYDARVRFRTPHGEKGYELVVNGSRRSGLLPRSEAFAESPAGKVELTEGMNTLAVERGWGFYEIDRIDLVRVKSLPRIRKPPKTLADPKATRKARALMAYLVDLYGKKTLSGQYGHDDSELIHRITGRWPAIMGGDLMDYSPSRVAHGTKPEGTVERMIRSATEGHLLTVLWHWNAPSGLIDKDYVNERGQTVRAPWWRGFYTDATTYDVKKALDAPDSEEYRLLLRDIDAIAAQLKKFADADIPVLWRPLHEAEGAWFWWGARGPEAYKRLWRLLHDRLTRHHGLHNLIWIHTGVQPDWYPGGDVVDLVGWDGYPSDTGDPQSETWEALFRRFNGKKLLALTEFGGVPDIEVMRRYGVRWSFFVTWTGSEGPRKTPEAAVRRRYGADAVLTRDEVRW